MLSRISSVARPPSAFVWAESAWSTYLVGRLGEYAFLDQKILGRDSSVVYVSYAGEIVHGQYSRITHDGRGRSGDVPQGIKSFGYHSLDANIDTFPRDLTTTATTEESGVTMGARHRRHTLEAVQYHEAALGTRTRLPGSETRISPAFEVGIIKGVTPTKEQQSEVPPGPGVFLEDDSHLPKWLGMIKPGLCTLDKSRDVQIPASDVDRQPS